MLVCIFFSANRTRDRGCSKHPVFPAPSDKEGGKLIVNLGHIVPRERVVIFCMVTYTGKYPLIAGRKKIAMLIANPMLQRIERSVGRLPR
jgi:hypothetical protein